MLATIHLTLPRVAAELLSGGPGITMLMDGAGGPLVCPPSTCRLLKWGVPPQHSPGSRALPGRVASESFLVLWELLVALPWLPSSHRS